MPRESSLHSAIKNWYSLPMDRLEAEVDGYVIDIVRGNLLIEVQTDNFSAIRKKLRSLIKKHKVLLVYPIAKRKWIIRQALTSSEAISRRRSPKKGRLTDVFDELMRMPDLVNEENFSLEVLMIEEEEIWCDDGKGSWRRRGASINDRKLVAVLERAKFKGKADFLRLLPRDLPQPLTNKSLAKSLGIPVRQSRRITYCLKKMGAMREIGKKGRELLFEVVPSQ